MEEKRGIATAIKLFGKTITLQREVGGVGHKPQGTAVTLKKSEKILPCPRCSSMDTKFCYYNNYNVNQPRHFCKNCQRYWTAGGTMRNVPVGAGRRRNKNPCHYRHISIPESALRFDQPSAGYPCFTTNATVLAFGSDTPLCNSTSMISSKMEETSRVVAPNQESNTQIPWNTPLPFCAPNVPIPVYPAAAYWSCAVAFLPKDNIKNHAPEAPSSLLHSNPAALARSLHFQESS